MRSGCWRIATRASHEPYKSHALLRGNARMKTCQNHSVDSQKYAELFWEDV